MLTEIQKSQLVQLISKEYSSAKNELVSVVELTKLAKEKSGLGKSEDGTYDLPSCLEMREFLNERNMNYSANGLAVFLSN